MSLSLAPSLLTWIKKIEKSDEIRTFHNKNSFGLLFLWCVCVCAGWMWFTVKLSLTYLISISLLSFSHSHINLFISIFTGGACSSVTLVRVWKCTHAHSIARHRRRRRRNCDNNNGKSEQNNSVPSLTLSTYNHDLRWDF